MKIKPSILLVVMIFLSACGGKPPATPTPAPTQATVVVSEILPKATPVCISPDPVDDDINRALTYSGELFNTPEWERSYTVAGGRVSVEWANGSIGSIAYLEALIFPCSYEEPDLDNFFDDENWQVVFGNYESFQAVSACKTNDGLRLYEFDATVDGSKYDIKYWVQNDTDTRVISAMIVFPVESQAALDEYAGILFPKLVSCP